MHTNMRGAQEYRIVLGKQRGLGKKRGKGPGRNACKKGKGVREIKVTQNIDLTQTEKNNKVKMGGGPAEGKKPMR